MDRGRWWDRWHVRTAFLISVALACLLGFHWSHARLAGALVTAGYVLAPITTIAAAVSLVSDLIKFARGKPAPKPEPAGHAEQTAARVGDAQHSSQGYGYPAPTYGYGTPPNPTARNGVLVGFNLAATIVMILLGVFIPVVVGWQFGGHGVHLLGDHIRAFNFLVFPFGLIVAIVVSACGLSVALCIDSDSSWSDIADAWLEGIFELFDFEEGAELAFLIGLGIFAATTVISGLFHGAAGGEAIRFLGLDHGSRLFCNWLELKFAGAGD